MIHDRQIAITVGRNRKDTAWRRQTLTVSELYERLKTPARGTETLEQYFKLSKGQQDDLKDVGGFVGGTLSGTRRKADAVTGRDIITLDFDNVPGWSTDNVLGKVGELGCGFCVYSTRKHMPGAPRLRILIPTDRTMTPDEYEPCARRVAERIGITMADPTTFEPSRLMYWPSCCADSDYVYRTSDAPFASVDALLGTYTDWRDIGSWPQCSGREQYDAIRHRQAVRQGDPTTKPGTVGAFCRAYDIYRAMDELLPGIYEHVSDERYTFLGGSTTGGAVVYENGKFLYSHHATDPCSGRLVNSFDLVRLHKFGAEDDAADPATPTNRLPSYAKMCEFANSIDEVAVGVMQERIDSADADFKGITVESPKLEANDASWLRKLTRDPSSGNIRGTIDNILIILENDPQLKGKLGTNEFAERNEVLGKLPWQAEEGQRRLWSDTDSDGLYWYLEKKYAVTGRKNIDSAWNVHMKAHGFNEVRDFLEGLNWDNVPRLDTLFIDYLGAEDTPYTRAVCRKAFTAAVARAMEPGCKFDNMVILCGPQGIGKSTLLDRMSRGFFNDSILTFEGKEASELLQGVWLVEIAELDAFRKSDVSRIKQFLSMRTDRYRAAYGRNVKEIPRRCVFFGTCNVTDFLRDNTGNRRFWPVDVGQQQHTKTVFNDLTENVISQLWAEAKVRWQLGEQLYLSGDIEQEAVKRQEEHREVDVMEGLIQEFVERQVPSDWSKWTLEQRRCFWNENAKGDIKLVDRDRICTAEVWCELYGNALGEQRGSDVHTINAVLAKLPDFKPYRGRFGKPYGLTQRGYIRIKR